MRRRIESHNIFEIYKDQRGKLYTKSLLKPAKSHFAERIFKQDNGEFREWEPKRSKLAAAVKNGCANTGIRKDHVILYLGASHGFTCSFVSDMIGKEGLIFALDHSPQVLRDLVFLSIDRKNIVPILADVNHLERYSDKVCQADVVFQDVSQRNQAEIFIKNCKMFLKEGGFGLIAVKARSIDVKKDSKIIFQEVRDQIEKEFTIVDFRDLAPHEKDHCMIIVKKNMTEQKTENKQVKTKNDKIKKIKNKIAKKKSDKKKSSKKK
jgi:fibrillarin-like pre-rRNA processing protein